MRLITAAAAASARDLTCLCLAIASAQWGSSASPTGWIDGFAGGNQAKDGSAVVIAPASAAVFGNQDLRSYPRVLVPLFTGPPLSILIHVALIKNLLSIQRRSHITGASR